MKLSVAQILLFLSWQQLTLAAVPAPSVASYSKCVTLLGPSSVANVPTTTYSFTLGRTTTVTTTSTPSNTVTLPPVTNTATSTATTTNTVTLPTPTTTVTSTVSVTETTTGTVTTFATSTETDTATTTSSVTSTIPAAAGFTPLSQEPDYVPKIKGRSPAPGAVAVRAPAAQPSSKITCTLPKTGPKKPVFNPLQYPKQVVCAVLSFPVTTKTVTVTATSTATQTATPAPVTVTTVTTNTATVTSYPPTVTASATTSTTTTATATTTATVTTVTTTTTTTTAYQTVATTYAACQSNNIVGAANGNKGIDTIYGGAGQYFGSASANTAYDCCVACQQTADTGGSCRGYFYYSGYCSYLSGGTCAAGVNSGEKYSTSESYPGGQAYIIGNGPCGAYANGGNY